MSETTARPLSFGLAAGKGGRKAIIFFFVILVIAVLTHIGVGITNYFKEQRSHPQLALKTFLKNVREFYAAQKRLPNNIRELEVKIWNKNNPGKASVLQYADNIWVSENYEYIYFTGMVGGVGQANVWAVPMGKYRDEAETVLMVIAPDGEDIWRGPALTEDQLASVLAKGFNPGLAQMSLLNMSKDQPVKVKEQSTKKFGIF